MQAKFDSLTKGHGMTADTLKEIYKTAKIDVTEAEINAQVYISGIILMLRAGLTMNGIDPCS